MWLDLLEKLSNRFEFIHSLWSLLPPKCRMSGCEKKNLRWTENEVEILSGPMINTIVPICVVCTQRLRMASFSAGLEVTHQDDGSIVYGPSSES